MKRRVLGFLVTALSCIGSTEAQTVDAGRTVFEQCATCHSLDGSSASGPTLLGVVGRSAGSVQGFRYSRALKRPGLTWDAASLDAFIADPQRVAAGNVMPFSGIADARQRADLIAFLNTLQAPAPQ